jgi:hypothetical protein
MIVPGEYHLGVWLRRFALGNPTTLETALQPRVDTANSTPSPSYTATSERKACLRIHIMEHTGEIAVCENAREIDMVCARMW